MRARLMATDSTTGASVGGVPVVDLTASTNALLHRVEWLRVEALNLITTAVTMREHADQLEELVAVLQGGTRG